MEIENLESLSGDALIEKYDDVRRKVLTLEWDKRHNQINSGMEVRYEELKKDFDVLKEKVRVVREAEAKEAPESIKSEAQPAE